MDSDGQLVKKKQINKMTAELGSQWEIEKKKGENGQVTHGKEETKSPIKIAVVAPAATRINEAMQHLPWQNKAKQTHWTLLLRQKARN